MKKGLIVTLVILLTLTSAYAYNAKIVASKDLSMIYFSLGKSYYENNDLDNSIKYFEKAIDLKENFPEAYHNLGIAYFDLGNSDKAVENLKTAIELDSDYAKAYYTLTLIYYEEKDYDNAINYLKKLTKLEDNPNANFDLAFIYVEKFRVNGEKDLDYLKNGLFYYEETLKLSPDFPNAENNLNIVKNVLSEY